MMEVTYKHLLIMDERYMWQPDKVDSSFNKTYEKSEIFKMLYDIGRSSNLTKYMKIEDVDHIIEKN